MSGEVSRESSFTKEAVVSQCTDLIFTKELSVSYCFLKIKPRICKNSDFSSFFSNTNCKKPTDILNTARAHKIVTQLEL